MILASLLTGTAASAKEIDVRKGQAAFGAWRDDAPGVRRLIEPGDLPAPMLTPSVSNFAEPAARPDGVKPQVPQGFSVDLVASGLEGPRILRVAPNGDVFVANSKANEVRVYRLAGNTAKLEKEAVFAKGLNKPYGIAFYPPGPDPRWVYVANTDSVVRFPYKTGDLTASSKPEPMINGIPYVHHWTRDIAFSQDGKTLFLSVGSGSNVATDMFPQPLEGGLEQWKKTQPLGAPWDTEEGRAMVLTFGPDGQNRETFATGLRNCSGLTLQPETGDLWCAVNERDGLGDDTPFEYATAVKKGAFYGWPWFFIGKNEDPRHKGERPDLRSSVTVPDVLFQAHSAPLGIAFYTGNAFPPEYSGDAFIAFHGSWNRKGRTGYKVVRVLFENGKPTGEYEDFMTGFVLTDDKVWGRPVGVAVAKDGSLLVSEDGNGTIWRVIRTSAN
jgi:glucose/arabinose dehydrogenase